MAVSTEAIQDAEFPIHWDDPADAEVTYEIDMMHHPHPISPLSQSIQPNTFAGWLTAMQEHGLPFKAMHVRFQNYYEYSRTEMIEPSSPEEAAAAGQAVEAKMQEQVACLADRWENEHLPRITEIIDRYAAIEAQVSEMSPPEILAVLDEFMALREEIWTIHFRIVVPMMIAIQLFAEFYQELFDGTEADAHALLVGRLTKSVAATIGLSDLAAHARTTGVDRLIADTALESLVEELGLSETGRDFLRRLDEYLETFGYRSDLFDVQTPLWSEAPEIPLASVRSFLVNGFDARTDHDAKARSADLLLNEARERLATYPAPVRHQFEGLLAAARTGAFLQEEHNYFIDQVSLARTRLIFLQIGARLVAEGLLQAADDIAMLHLDEIKRLLSGPIDDTIRARTRSTVSERSAEMDRAASLTPPPFLGPPPEGQKVDNVLTRALRGFWGAPPQAADSPDQLRGNAGARGIATGEAFVAHSLAEAAAIKPGQVLVATTTMPAWTPFFGIAAAVVTETGGPLSHCAIVAREYGIPAVVGAAGAMRAIRHGQRITVDGDRGEVRLTPDPLPA